VRGTRTLRRRVRAAPCEAATASSAAILPSTRPSHPSSRSGRSLGRSTGGETRCDAVPLATSAPALRIGEASRTAERSAAPFLRSFCDPACRREWMHHKPQRFRGFPTYSRLFPEMKPIGEYGSTWLSYAVFAPSVVFLRSRFRPYAIQHGVCRASAPGTRYLIEKVAQ